MNLNKSDHGTKRSYYFFPETFINYLFHVNYVCINPSISLEESFYDQF